MVVSDLTDVRSDKSVADPMCLRFTITFFVCFFLCLGDSCFCCLDLLLFFLFFVSPSYTRPAWQIFLAEFSHKACVRKSGICVSSLRADCWLIVACHSNLGYTFIKRFGSTAVPVAVLQYYVRYTLIKRFGNTAVPVTVLQYYVRYTFIKRFGNTAVPVTVLQNYVRYTLRDSGIRLFQ